MAQQPIYRISNSTVKPPRKDKAGRDMRTAIEKVGHSVSFRDHNDKVVMLMPNKSVISQRIDEGLLNLRRGGYVKIEQIDNIADALKEHTLENRAANRADKEQAAAETKANERRASSVEMGKDTYKQESGKEYEGARNPDGDPNFIATVGKKQGRKKRSRSSQEEVVPEAGENA